MIFSFFFFQAEDGIRDTSVTGVQTCALPIYPGSPVDVEPDHPWQHGSRITIRDNEAVRCYRGIGLVLQTGDPTSENFRTESITGNHIRGTLYQCGILVLMQQARATMSDTITEGAAGDG